MTSRIVQTITNSLFQYLQLRRNIQKKKRVQMISTSIHQDTCGHNFETKMGYKRYAKSTPLIAWEYVIIGLYLFHMTALVSINIYLMVTGYTNSLAFDVVKSIFIAAYLSVVVSWILYRVTGKEYLYVLGFHGIALIHLSALALQLIHGDCEFGPLLGKDEDCRQKFPVVTLGRITLFPLLYYHITKVNFGASIFVAIMGCVIQVACGVSIYGYNFVIVNYVVLVAVGLVYLILSSESTRMSAYLGLVRLDQLRKIRLKSHESEKSQLRAVLWNVAHDMKTPMQSFVAGLHVMQENPSRVRTLINTSSDFKLKRDVEGVLRETSAAAQEMSASCELLMMQLNRAMDVSSLENDLQTEKPHLSATPIQETISDVSLVISTLQCDKTKVRLVRLPSYLSTHVMTARSWFADNLLCVVANAAKYSPPNSTVHVQLSVHLFEELRCFGAPNLQFGEGIKDEDKFLLVKVTDAGINDVKHGELFARITQSDRSMGGAGLGLYALRLRMVRLGGVCGSRPRQDGNHGSEFFFAIPYYPVDSEGKPVSVVDQTMVGTSSPWDVTEYDLRSGASTLTTVSSIKTSDLSAGLMDDDGRGGHGVLVVDDSLPTLKLVTRLFKNIGANVTTASNGQQALDAMKKKLFSLVLMDVEMPVMDGLTSTVLFRDWEINERSRDGTHQLIIASSAIDCRARALRAGADYYFDKPMSAKMLLSFYQSQMSKPKEAPPSSRNHDHAFELQDV